MILGRYDILLNDILTRQKNFKIRFLWKNLNQDWRKPLETKQQSYLCSKPLPAQQQALRPHCRRQPG
jgi:hypothetical protein